MSTAFYFADMLLRQPNLSRVIAAYCSYFGHLAFLCPLGGGLRTTYDVYLRLIGKRVVDFLLALIELFSLGVTAEALRAIIG